MDLFPPSAVFSPLMEPMEEEEQEEENEEDTSEVLLHLGGDDHSWEGLQTLLQNIRLHFPDLHSERHLSHSGMAFVRASRASLFASDLPFVHPFHVVFIPAKEAKTVFIAKLVTFHGRTIKTERVEITGNGLDSKLLLGLSSRSFTLCPGLGERTLRCLEEVEDILIEPVNEKTTMRSRRCEYVVMDGAKSRCCGGCKALAREMRWNICPEEKNQKAEVKNKARVINVDELFRVREPKKEEVKTEVKRVSARETLEQLVRLGGIQIDKTDGFQGQEELDEEEDWAFADDNDDGMEVERVEPVKSKKKSMVMLGVKPKVILKVNERVDNPKKTGRRAKNKHVANMAVVPEGVTVKPTIRSPEIVVKTKEKKKADEQPRVLQTCRLCLFEHDRAHVFERHLEVHVQRFKLEVPVSCPVCGITLPNKFELNPHFQSAHDPSKGCCPECLLITEARALRRHLEYSHYITVKNKLCSECGKSFRTRQELEIHAAVQHGTSQNVICDVCGKVLSHPKVLAKHIRTAHVYNEKGRHRCPFCDKVFDKVMAWQKHIKVHSRVKPFRCGFCDYRSVKRFNILLHMRKRHKEDATYADLIKDGEFDYGVPLEDIEMAKFLIPEPAEEQTQ